MSPARLSSVTMSFRISRTSSRFAASTARRRWAACALLRIAVSGWFSSWASDSGRAPPGTEPAPMCVSYAGARCASSSPCVADKPIGDEDFPRRWSCSISLSDLARSGARTVLNTSLRRRCPPPQRHRDTGLDAVGEIALPIHAASSEATSTAKSRRRRRVAAGPSSTGTRPQTIHSSSAQDRAVPPSRENSIKLPRSTPRKSTTATRKARARPLDRNRRPTGG